MVLIVGPAAACAFSGQVDGVAYSASNGGVADDEGGNYTTSLLVTAMTEEVAQGLGHSTYQHPEMQCEWDTSLSLTRGEEEELDSN